MSVWVEKRGASTACCGFMPEQQHVQQQLQIGLAWSSPPGQPTVITGTPFSHTR